jgi:nicotinamidase-related amidase
MSLPAPPFFDPASAGRVFRVPYGERAQEAREWAVAHGIAPAEGDRPRTALLLVDVQNTFCLPEFELFVGGRSGRGAVEDSARLSGFLYRHLPRLTQVVVTLDTHTAVQIFHPVFWLDEKGEHPPPHTVVSLGDVETGRWRVNPAIVAAVAPLPGFDVEAWARHYVRGLHEGGKYPLVVWPYHSMVGGIGHALVSLVEEAVFFHSIARQSPTRVEVKGRNLLTENYSVLRPEVLEDSRGERVAAVNTDLLEHLLSFDAVIVAGQAKSHCVAWTVEDLLAEIRARDPQRAGGVYLLEDCSSPVVVPGVVDFTDPAEAAYARFAEAGMHRVLSTTPMKEWPGVLGVSRTTHP